MTGVFRYVELVTGGAAKRGRIIELPAGVDGPDYYGKVPVTDAYCSVYRFDSGLAAYVDKTGSVRGYNGPCKPAALHFDFDGPEALADVRGFIEKVCDDKNGLEIYIDNFMIFFSGNKGFHVHIHHPDIDGIAPGADVPAKIKKLAVKLAGGFTSFDRAVYDRTRIFRIPNSKHGKSGLFKVPLLAGEIFKLNIDGIRALAVKQRSVKDAIDSWFTNKKAA